MNMCIHIKFDLNFNFRLLYKSCLFINVCNIIHILVSVFNFFSILIYFGKNITDVLSFY